ncbi:MAG: hypothetical protein MUF15_17605, partial [Acidobacteria bacterium]|nr:hypothetical protein [Acidobacteriota bacterium]
SFFTVSIFYRVLVNGDRHKKILLILTSALAPLLHSTSVFMVGIPAAIIILLKFKTISKKNWLVLGAAACAVVLLNLFWLIPFFQNFKYTNFNDVAWTGQAEMLTGAVQWLTAILFTMGGLFALVYGVTGLKVLYRQPRRELAILSAGVLAVIFLARWPGWLITRSIQPNRFALSFLLYLLIPVIAYLGTINPAQKLLKPTRVRHAGNFSRTVCISVLVISLVIPCGIMAAIRLGNPSAFRASPTLMIANILFGRTIGPGCLAEPETRELIHWLNTHTSPGKGRIMIEHPQGEGTESPFAVFYSGLITGIANFVDGQFLGAPRFEPPLLHNQLTRMSHCSMFDIPLKELTQEKLLKRLELYNVKWIVAVQGTMTAYLDQFPELLRPVKTIANVAIYEVQRQGSYFLKGSGQIRVSLNQIHLAHLEGDDVIIKYHWAKGFQANPPAVLEPFYPPEDGVGFIRLRYPPRKVTLYFRGAGLEKCTAEGDKKP